MGTVAEQARLSLDRLPPAERRVVRALLADYPSAGLSTVADLATRAAVSSPTVVRCAQSLGFEGFPALQAALRAELTARTNGPLASVPRPHPVGSILEQLLHRGEQITARGLAGYAAIPPADLEKAVELLADLSRPVYAVGGRFSHVLAEYLVLLFEQLRPRVHYLADPFGGDHGTLLDATRRDVYVVFDLQRYQAGTLSLVREVRRRGVAVVVVTDEQLSPAASYADAVLPAAVTIPAAEPTIAAALLLCELLVTPVLERLGETAHTRLALWEDSHSKHARQMTAGTQE